MNYFRTWFILDIIALLPIDILVVVGAFDTGPGSSSALVRAVRLLRAMRLLKLVRILRASRLVSKWENKVAKREMRSSASACRSK